MAGIDRWEGSPADLPTPLPDFVIERVGHGLTEDRTWRTRYNQDRTAGVPVGFYYVPETPDVVAQARFFRGLVEGIDHTMGDWLDYAVGDLGNMAPSEWFVDQFRSVIDTGLYVNGAAFGQLPRYQRFERLWFAGSSPPARWLLWQTLGLNAGDDIDQAADVGGVLRPHWSAFDFPNP